MIRVSTRLLAVSALLGAVSCRLPDRQEPFPQNDWVDLSAYARPTILKNPGEPDTDLLGLRREVEERRAAEALRLAAQPKVSVAFVDLPVTKASGGGDRPDDSTG